LKKKTTLWFTDYINGIKNKTNSEQSNFNPF